MTARRFKLVFEDGSVFHCAAFDSEAAREQALATVHQGAPRDAPSQEPRPRGRPSFDDTIATAVDALGEQLKDQSLAARTRLVLRQFAQTVTDASLIPSWRTVETYLAEQPVRRKSRNKSRRKSWPVKIAS
jgi:hypothetical protein